MKKLIKIFSVLLIVCIIFCSCATQQQNAGYYTFTDDLNYQVVLSAKPIKVAVLISSYAEIWQIAGGNVSITVGETVERKICNDTVLLVDGGAGKTINTELLLSFKPDFIIGSADLSGHIAAFDQLKTSNIPFALMHVESFNDYLKVLKIFCDITENKDAYKTYGLDIKEKIDDLILKTKNKKSEKVLFIRSGSSLSSLKAKSYKDHFAAAMLKELGALNIADEAPILLNGLSSEVVLTENPNCIFVSTMGNEKAAKKLITDTFKKVEWKNVSAVKNNNVIFLEKDLFQFKPNHRWYEAYLFLAKTLYGENIA